MKKRSAKIKNVYLKQKNVYSGTQTMYQPVKLLYELWVNGYLHLCLLGTPVDERWVL